jgi:Lar family restriction alleviation protein
MKANPCPWCECKEVFVDFHTPDREGMPIAVICSDCGAQGPYDYYNGTEDEMVSQALAKWNNRR